MSAVLNPISSPPPYPGGVTEVLVDIAECLAARHLNYPGDSRDRYADLWDWAVEFDAQFLAKSQLEEGPDPGDTYCEDVEDFAVAKATADGWLYVEFVLAPGAAPAEPATPSD